MIGDHFSNHYKKKLMIFLKNKIIFLTYNYVISISDCTELHCESTTNYTQQGNLYSNYKHNCTIKSLIAVTPAGHPSFISYGFEGSISDYEITKVSGFIDHLKPGDHVLMDRGFLIGKMEAL